jgi:hypothetical protein
MSNEYQLIRATIEKFIQGKLTTYEWDDNMSIACADQAAESLRQIAWQVFDLFPPAKGKDFCSEAGIHFLKLILQATSYKRRE